MGEYKYLFREGKIGNLVLKNRTVMAPMGSGMETLDTIPSERSIAYFSERAKGGVGLIIGGCVRVNNVHGKYHPRQMSLAEDRCIPGLKLLADELHKYGTKLFLQLHHQGVMGYSEVNEGQPLMTPSGITSPWNEPTQIITKEAIAGLVEDFGTAAARAKKADIDGVEIHATNNYLLHTFLTPHYNKRTDEYGGSLENRFRFLKEVYLSVRKSVGYDYPVTVRISLEEYLEDGYHIDEGIQFCKWLDELGVDAIHLNVGLPLPGRCQNLEDVFFGEGWRKSLGKQLKSVVSCPVIGTTVIRDPKMADELIRDGYLDFAASGRCYLADPEWAEKSRTGRENEIRKCIACLRCAEKRGRHGDAALTCSVNPECGREALVPELKKDGCGRKIVVIGGGPAGLECARTAAKRGFAVTMFEKSKALGGQIYMSSRSPGKERMGWFIEYERRQLESLGVDICTEHAPTIDEVAEMKPYAVFDATGGEQLRPKFIKGSDRENVLTVDQVLLGQVDVSGKSVVVVGSGLTGLETSLMLCEKGCLVTVLEMMDTIAPGAFPIHLKELLMRLEIYSAVLIPSRKLLEIGPNGVICENTKTGDIYEIPAEYVMLSMGVRSRSFAAEEEAGKLGRVIKIGDAAATGRLLEAVRSGYDAAIALE